jgi:hypothetical protein
MRWVGWLSCSYIPSIAFLFQGIQNQIGRFFNFGQFIFILSTFKKRKDHIPRYYMHTFDKSWVRYILCEFWRQLVDVLAKKSAFFSKPML